MQMPELINFFSASLGSLLGAPGAFWGLLGLLGSPGAVWGFLGPSPRAFWLLVPVYQSLPWCGNDWWCTIRYRGVVTTGVFFSMPQCILLEGCTIEWQGKGA